MIQIKNNTMNATALKGIFISVCPAIRFSDVATNKHKSSADSAGIDILIRFCFFCRRRTQTDTDGYPKPEYGIYAENMP
jgi:hypothetical protein